MCALLGRNGAGKTTTVRILTTLLPADAGRARVAGFDVTDQAPQVPDQDRRHRPDRDHGRAAHRGRRTWRPSGASATWERPPRGGGPTSCSSSSTSSRPRDQLVKRYSGGMRRRLDLAASLITTPRCSSSTSPPPGWTRSAAARCGRRSASLVAGGTTVLLTTQYLDEADRLADTIVVIDRGLVVAEGTPEQLKASIGRPLVRVTLPDADPGVRGAGPAAARRGGGGARPVGERARAAAA